MPSHARGGVVGLAGRGDEGEAGEEMIRREGGRGLKEYGIGGSGYRVGVVEGGMGWEKVEGLECEDGECVGAFDEREGGSHLKEELSCWWGENDIGKSALELRWGAPIFLEASTNFPLRANGEGAFCVPSNWSTGSRHLSLAHFCTLAVFSSSA